MVHNLYRFYLYTVFLAMLIFAAIGLGLLLQPLLAFTPLRGSYGASPTTAVIVQGSVFFGVSWLIAGLLGGLHYWLIELAGGKDALGLTGKPSRVVSWESVAAAELSIFVCGHATKPPQGVTPKPLPLKATASTS